jgi:hypothetical protein
VPSIIRTLEQEEMWYGEDGYPYVVEEMDQDHRVNVLRMLKRRAYQLLKQKLFDEIYNRRPDDLLPSQIEAQIRDKTALLSDPEAWLSERPFVIALERAIRNHGTIDGEVVEVPEIEPARRELT